MIPARLIVYGVAVAALAAGALWYRHSLIAEGKAQVQALWDADEAAEKAVADAASLEALRQDAEDAQRNEGVIRDLNEKHAADLAGRDNLYRLLQRHAATTDTIRASQIAGSAAALAASETRRDERLDGLLADALTDARLNADQLDALIAVVKPQM